MVRRENPVWGTFEEYHTEMNVNVCRNEQVAPYLQRCFHAHHTFSFALIFGHRITFDKTASVLLSVFI